MLHPADLAEAVAENLLFYSAQSKSAGMSNNVFVYKVDILIRPSRPTTPPWN